MLVLHEPTLPLPCARLMPTPFRCLCFEAWFCMRCTQRMGVSCPDFGADASSSSSSANVGAIVGGVVGGVGACLCAHGAPKTRMRVSRGVLCGAWQHGCAVLRGSLSASAPAVPQDSSQPPAATITVHTPAFSRTCSVAGSGARVPRHAQGLAAAGAPPAPASLHGKCMGAG